MAPLYDLPAGVLAIPVGFAFGVILERVGLGSARTITQQLVARDFTVITVMFSAIVTAMLGVFWADHLGWLDLSRVTLPSTDMVPQLIGALLFGAGFAIASLCPGTACVSAATGKGDGLVTIGGLFLGTLVTSLFWPQLGALAERAPHDNATLPVDLHLPVGIVVAAITILGVATLFMAGRLQGGRAPFRVSPLAAIALALGVLAAATGRATLASAATLRQIGAEIDSGSDHVDAIALAEWIRARKPHLRIVDVRDDLAADDYRIPGAEEVPLQRIAALSVRPSDTIVIYSDGGGHAAQAWLILRQRGVATAYVLRDGLEAWEDEIMAPRRPDSTDAVAVARFQYVRELASFFGGRPSNERAAPRRNGADSLAKTAPAPPKRRKAC